MCVRTFPAWIIYKIMLTTLINNNDTTVWGVYYRKIHYNWDFHIFYGFYIALYSVSE